MRVIDNVVVSDEILSEEFVCNLNACKGACCKAGDAGAPLEQDEVDLIEREYEEIKPFIEAEGRDRISQVGKAIWKQGEFKTPLRADSHCAYSIEDESRKLSCGIEKAFEAGKASLRKPISCHLYPIRVKKQGTFEHLRYDRWDICSAACALGRQLKVPIYKFVKEGLVRKYGESFYDKLSE